MISGVLVLLRTHAAAPSPWARCVSHGVAAPWSRQRAAMIIIIAALRNILFAIWPLAFASRYVLSLLFKLALHKYFLIGITEYLKRVLVRPVLLGLQPIRS